MRLFDHFYNVTAKKEGTIQYGYRKYGTHAQVLSQTSVREQKE